MSSVSALTVMVQNNSSGALASAFSGAIMLVWLALVVVLIAGGWKTFEKAGQPGWAILIPFYNVYIMLKIAGRPGWWLLLYLIPLVNLAILVVVAMDVAKSFGQSAAWGFFLLFLLCGIGYLILGFGSARYLGPSANPQARVATA
jgi:Family of unknown function (DUF5684)